MKKYFIKDTEDEVQFGDTIKVTGVKSLKDGGEKHLRLECEFTPEIVDMLIEQEIIEEKKTDTEEGVKFNMESYKDDNCPMVCIVDAVEALGQQIDILTKEIFSLKKKLNDIVKK